MIYGHNKTIHGTQLLNIEQDKNGKVVSVWFRCCALPFDITRVGKERSEEMSHMYKQVRNFKLNAVDIEVPE